MRFKVVYHPDVIRIDLPKINRNIQKRIKKAIQERLGVDPVSYSDPLRQTLHGYMRMRVGDYRVVFRAREPNIIAIIVISHRKEVYQMAAKRLN